jgi:hypothetical protein
LMWVRAPVRAGMELAAKCYSTAVAFRGPAFRPGHRRPLRSLYEAGLLSRPAAQAA